MSLVTLHHCRSGRKRKPRNRPHSRRDYHLSQDDAPTGLNAQEGKPENALDGVRAASHAKGVDSPLLVGCRRWPTKRDFFGKPLPFPSEPAKSASSPPATANVGSFPRG